MSWDGKFKYEPMSPDKVKLIMEAYKNEQVYDYIMELYELVNYQKDIINQQRVQIIALKHKEAWKHYDRPLDQYNTEQRKYVDRPDKSGNMSC
jgi:hypothetical protein